MSRYLCCFAALAAPAALPASQTYFQLTNSGEHGAAEEHGSKECPSLRPLQPYGLEAQHPPLHCQHNVVVTVGSIICKCEGNVQSLTHADVNVFSLDCLVLPEVRKHSQHQQPRQRTFACLIVALAEQAST